MTVTVTLRERGSNAFLELRSLFIKIGGLVSILLQCFAQASRFWIYDLSLQGKFTRQKQK